MKFIYTDANWIEQGFINKASIDIEIGKYKISNNDFELSMSTINRDSSFDDNSIFFCNETEYGGIVKSKVVDTSTNSITFKGKTFRGLLEKEYIQPSNGQSHYLAIGEANQFLNDCIQNRFGDLFVVDNIGLSDITVNYQIRDLNMLDAFEKALYKADIPSRLDVNYYDGKVHIQAIPIIDLSELLSYDNSYGLSMHVETQPEKYNHILALGKGELTDRIRVNLYMKKDGTWSTSFSSFYKNLERKTYKYEDTNQESVDELISSSIEKVIEQNGTPNLSVNFVSDDAELFNIVGAKEEITNLEFKDKITKKILKGSINNDINSIKIEYKVGD